jgi:hypothetical protein
MMHRQRTKVQILATRNLLFLVLAPQRGIGIVPARKTNYLKTLTCIFGLISLYMDTDARATVPIQFLAYVK